MNAHIPNGSYPLFYGSICVEKHMTTWAVEFIFAENITTCIKDFQVTVFKCSSLWIFFLSQTQLRMYCIRHIVATF